MRNAWARFVRWLAREHIAYLEYENKELRFETQRWHDRYEGALSAVRIFEARYNHMWNNLVEAESLKLPAPIILEKKP